MSRVPENREGTFRLILQALSGVLLLFIVAPLIGLALSTSVDELRGAALDEDVRRSIALTLGCAMTATLVACIPAVPLAYLLARRRIPYGSAVSAVIDLPIVIPHAAAGIALLTILTGDSLIARAAEPLGIEFVSTTLGIGVAMAFVSVPYLVHAAREGFEAIPEEVERTAQNLGATPARSFLEISLPMARRSIVSGMVLMWARGMSEFGAVVFIAYRPMIAPILIWERFGAFGLAYARPVAVLFIALCLVLFFVLRYLQRDTNHADR